MVKLQLKGRIQIRIETKLLSEYKIMNIVFKIEDLSIQIDCLFEFVNHYFNLCFYSLGLAIGSILLVLLRSNALPGQGLQQVLNLRIQSGLGFQSTSKRFKLSTELQCSINFVMFQKASSIFTFFQFEKFSLSIINFQTSLSANFHQISFILVVSPIRRWEVFENDCVFSFLKKVLTRCLIILLTNKNLMEPVQFSECQVKIDLCKSCQGTASPSPTSTTGNIMEGKAHSDAGDSDRFEMDAQIQLNNAEEAEKNQQKKHWNLEEETLLLELHAELGNKWTDIANRLSGRDHNSVKNYFYAKIRKSLRRLNFFIKSYFNKQLKQLNTNHISKMITLLSQKSLDSEETEARLQEMKQIKTFLFETSRKNQQDHLDSHSLRHIRQNVVKISELVDSVKKNNIIIKKIKGKGKDKEQEDSQVVVRKCSMNRKSARLDTTEQEILHSPKEIQPAIKYEQSSNNYMLMFVPYEYQPKPLSLFATHYQQFWLNSTGQYIFFGSNIYGNS